MMLCFTIMMISHSSMSRDTPGNLEEEFDEPGDDYPSCVEDYEEIALQRAE